jgi:hypothetical protein
VGTEAILLIVVFERNRANQTYLNRHFASEYEGAHPEEVRAYGACEDRASAHPLVKAFNMYAPNLGAHAPILARSLRLAKPRSRSHNWLFSSKGVGKAGLTVLCLED